MREGKCTECKSVGLLVFYTYIYLYILGQVIVDHNGHKRVLACKLVDSGYIMYHTIITVY